MILNMWINFKTQFFSHSLFVWFCVNCVMCRVSCFTKLSWPLSLCFMVNFKWCDLIFWIANIQDNCIQSFASHSLQNQCILVLSCCYMYALCQIFTEWCMYSRFVLDKICYTRLLYTSLLCMHVSLILPLIWTMSLHLSMDNGYLAHLDKVEELS